MLITKRCTLLRLFTSVLSIFWYGCNKFRPLPVGPVCQAGKHVRRRHRRVEILLDVVQKPAGKILRLQLLLQRLFNISIFLSNNATKAIAVIRNEVSSFLSQFFQSLR